MRRTTLILSALAAVTVGIVLWVVFSPDEDMTQPGDRGVTAAPSSTSSANPEESSSAEEETGLAGDVSPDGGSRTELATLDPDSVPAEVAPAGLSLRVVDPEGQPIEGLQARLVTGHSEPGFAPWVSERPDQEALLEQLSDANGALTLHEVPPRQELSLVLGGDYWVEERLPLAALQAGEQRELGDLAIARGVLVSGRVTSEGGRPLAEAAVSLNEQTGNAMPDGVFFGGMESGVRRSAKTDADGRFRIPGVPPKEYSLASTKTGQVRAEIDLTLSLSNPDHRVQLRMGDGGWVNGVVRDEDGRPIPEARVALIPARGFAAYQWDAERILAEGLPVGEDGSFRLNGVPEDNSQRVVASAPGFGRGRSDRVLPGTKVEISLAPRVGLSGTLVDAAGEPVHDAIVRARPSGSNGMPPVPGNFDGPGMQSTRTDEAGKFSFADLSTGSYDLDVVAAAGTLSRPGVEVVADAPALELQLPDGQATIVRVVDVDGQAIEGAHVRITPVVDRSSALGDLGAREVRISVDSEGMIREFGRTQSRSGRTDPGGLIRFLNLAPGEYTVEVRKESFADTTEKFERKDEEDQLVVIGLPKASSLRVLAVDASGNPIEDVSLELARVDADPEDKHTERSDAWGLAMFTGLTPGAYTLREVENRGSGSFSWSGGTGESNEEAPTPQEEVLRFELAEGEVGEQQLVLAAKALPTVLVTRLGVPVPNASVQLEEVTDPGNGMMFLGFPGMGGGETTNAKGLAKLSPRDPGSYRLKARAAATSPYSETEVTLAPGSQQLTIELATGAVSGTVTGSGGPLADARVSLNRVVPEGESSTTSRAVGVIALAAPGDDESEIETFDFSHADARARSDQDGQFRFLDVPPGRYTMTVKAKGHQPMTTPEFVVDEGTQADQGVLALELGASLSGRVMNLPSRPEGQPVYHLLRLEDEEGNNVRYGSVQASGKYRFEELEPGNYRLRFDMPEGEDRYSEVIRVEAGAPTNFDFPL